MGPALNLLPPRGSLLVVPPGLNELMGIEVSPAIALAWAILVESEPPPPPVDVGPCPECKGKGTVRATTWGWDTDAAARGAVWRLGYEALFTEHHTKDAWTATYERPCHACDRSGRKLAPVPRLLLDATKPCTRCDDTGAIDRETQARPCPDCGPRQALRVLADELQAAGDERGQLLAWALGPWSGEPSACGECPKCNGFGRSHCDCSTGVSRGHGQLFGYPHTAEAVRWLEWLTWARDIRAAV